MKMQLSLIEISETNFNKLELPILFNDKLTGRVFGVISDGINGYKLSWQSTFSKPKLMLIDGFRYSVGIDLNFVIFDISSKQILRSIDLFYFFYDAKIHMGFLYVITELEIIRINILDLEVDETYALTDYFESMDFLEDSIIVKSVDGNVYSITN